MYKFPDAYKPSKLIRMLWPYFSETHSIGWRKYFKWYFLSSILFFFYGCISKRKLVKLSSFHRTACCLVKLLIQSGVSIDLSRKGGAREHFKKNGHLGNSIQWMLYKLTTFRKKSLNNTATLKHTQKLPKTCSCSVKWVWKQNH